MNMISADCALFRTIGEVTPSNVIVMPQNPRICQLPSDLVYVEIIMCVSLLRVQKGKEDLSKAVLVGQLVGLAGERRGLPTDWLSP